VVVLVDLDDFKRVNDTLGHAVGDRVLIAVARRFADIAGQVLVARLGGDEFVGLLDWPTTDDRWLRQSACLLADALAAPLDVAGRGVVVTVSVGLAPVPAAADLDDVLDRADAAMYQAKTMPGRFSWPVAATSRTGWYRRVARRSRGCRRHTTLRSRRAIQLLRSNPGLLGSNFGFPYPMPRMPRHADAVNQHYGIGLRGRSFRREPGRASSWPGPASDASESTPSRTSLMPAGTASVSSPYPPVGRVALAASDPGAHVVGRAADRGSGLAQYSAVLIDPGADLRDVDVGQ
jgi:diguanylate cyclase (GGDEF)-like protein